MNAKKTAMANPNLPQGIPRRRNDLLPSLDIPQVVRRLHNAMSGQWLCDSLSLQSGGKGKGGINIGTSGCSFNMFELMEAVQQKVSVSIHANTKTNPPLDNIAQGRKLRIGSIEKKDISEMELGSHQLIQEKTAGFALRTRNFGNDGGGEMRGVEETEQNVETINGSQKTDSSRARWQVPVGAARKGGRSQQFALPLGHLVVSNGIFATGEEVGGAVAQVGGNNGTGISVPQGAPEGLTESKGNTLETEREEKTSREMEKKKGLSVVKDWVSRVRSFKIHLSDENRKRTRKGKLTVAEQAEFEERAFAAALATGKRATILEFYSQRCRLCRSLERLLVDVEGYDGDWLNIVKADVENPRWMPEVSHYDIQYVPCFVLIDSRGTALAKTGVPYSRPHVVQGLSYLVQSMRPFKRAKLKVGKVTTESLEKLEKNSNVKQVDGLSEGVDNSATKPR